MAELKKMQEYMLKSYDENIVENGYWLGVLESYALTARICIQDIRKR